MALFYEGQDYKMLFVLASKSEYNLFYYRLWLGVDSKNLVYKNMR